MMQQLNLQRCSTAYSKNSFDSQTLVKPENFQENDFIVQQIINLTQTNFELAQQYFQGIPQSELTKTFQNKNQLFYQKDFISIERKKLTKILSTLVKTKNILVDKFGIQGQMTNNDQYRFLRNIWSTHNKRERYEDWEDQCDGLNKVIGMMKNRVRTLTQKESDLNNRFWQEQITEPISPTQNPLFSHMQEKLSSQSMLIDEMSYKFGQSVKKNSVLQHKIDEYEQKVQTLKNKNKKGERKYYEITKEKVNLEKKVFDMEVKMKKKEGKENFEENSSSMFIDLSGVKLVQESYIKYESQEPNQGVIQTDRTDISHRQSDAIAVSNIQAAIRKKYRNRNGNDSNRKKKPLVLQSSSNSILNSSITTLKFERTNSKRSLLTSRSSKQLLNSITKK